MGGKVHDRKSLVVDRDPSKTMAVEVGKFAKPNPIDLAAAFGRALLDYGLDAFKNVTGIDLKSWTSFLDDLPGFDAGKIISGIFSGGLIPGLDASKIVSGVFNTVVIPFLDAGKIISGIFTGGLIPGLDASKIVSGQFPQSIIAGLTGLLSAFPGGNIVGSIASSLLSGVLGAGLIPGLDASKIVSGSFAQSQVAGLPAGLSDLGNGLQGAVNGIVNGLKGLTGQYWTQADATAALKQQAAAVAAAAAAVAALQGEQGADAGGGVNIFVDFSKSPDSANMPAAFTETYVGGSASTPPGSWGIASGAAVCTNNEDYYERKMALTVYNLGVTATDYQKVVGVWNGAPGVGYQNPTPFFTPVPYYNPFVSEHILTFRWKDALNHCRIRFAGDAIGIPGTAYLEAVVNGTVTVLGSPFAHVFQPNTAYTVEAGLGGGLRIFRVSQGQTPIATITDSGNVSQVGALFRGGGPGAVMQGAQGASLPANPAGLVAWGMSDNNPNNLTLGKQARFYRANTAAVGVNTANPTVLPANFFDTIDYNVGGIFTWTPATGRIAVSEKGLYQIVTRIGWNAGNLIDIHLWKGNGSGAPALYKQGMTQSWAAYGVFYANLAAGDYVTLAAKSNGGGGTGTADGSGTYLEIRQVLSGAPA